MGWLETCAVDERMRFMIAVQKREDSFSALCRRFIVSRKTGYKPQDRLQMAWPL
jgi:putative transposase